MIEDSQPDLQYEVSFNKDEIRRYTDSSDWKNLAPNYNRYDALQPADLDSDAVVKIVEAITQENVISSFSKQAKDRPQILAIEGIGTLEMLPAGKGQQKLAFVLNTEAGKKMIVKLSNGYNGGNTIPEDPRMYMSFQKADFAGNVKFWEYSDMRTYFIAQSNVIYKGADLNFGVIFQEYGGEQHLNALAPFTKNNARRRVERYMREKGLTCDDSHEFEHDHHYLIPGGRLKAPAVIDVLFKSKS